MGRIGIYGGTFNPPHRGHISAARQAIDLLELDKLLLIPASVPPHKTLPENSPTAMQRLELVQLAFGDIHRAEICDLELKRQGHSYTVDTVEELHRRYPEDELYLIMGTDMFTTFLQWYQPERICRYVTLAVFMRESRDTDSREQMLALARQIREKLQGRVELVGNDILPMSSTDVRRMTAFGAAQEILPENVCQRIHDLNLYGIRNDYRSLSMEELERRVVTLLDPKRVPHVLGCRDMAVKLAEHYGTDPVDAARAGLLHDITKALSPQLQETLCRAHRVLPEQYAHENPKTLHAFTGALVAQKVFGENEAVTRAICSHTTGCGDMNTLQKIIYIADYVEMNRDFPGVESLRTLAFEDLDRAMLTGLRMTVDLLLQQGRVVSQNSLSAIASLEKTNFATA